MAKSGKTSLGAKPVVHTTPVVLVATYDDLGRPNVMTAASLGYCSVTPPTLTLAVRPETFTHKCLSNTRALTLNFPSLEQLAACDFIGSVSGAEVDKFRSASLTPVPSDLVNAPLISECKMTLECCLRQALDVGSHTLFIVEVLDLKADPDVLSSDGEIDFGLLNPLIYYALSSSYALGGEDVGRAGHAGRSLTADMVQHHCE